MTRWLGIDVGGANLKLSDGDGYARSVSFELWQRHHELGAVLRDLLTEAPRFDAIAATMTGELADCYSTKREGVRHITNSLLEAAGDHPLAIYSVSGQFRTGAATLANPLSSAASNWHALARYAARWLPGGSGVLVDIGSTTTDIIPLRDGKVATESRTDLDRLLAGELVYTGMSRTPVCAVVHALPYCEAMCPVAAELFATTADVYQLLGWLEGKEADTADGRDLSQQHCIDRLARQICADREAFTLSDARFASQHVVESQLAQLSSKVGQVVSHLDGVPTTAIVSGSGERLAQKLATGHEKVDAVCELSGQLGREISDCAAAAAVAVLAGEEVVE